MDKYENFQKKFEKLLHEIDDSLDMIFVEQFMKARTIQDLQESFSLSGSESFKHLRLLL